MWCLYKFTIFALIIRINGETGAKNESKAISRKELYQYGFQIKRAEQIEGVKKISKMEDQSKKSAMIKILLEKLFMVLMKAKLSVMESGYIPGDEFPQNQQDLDALGNVFENVAFFGDLVLRCPDVTHKIYNNNSEWRIAMNWGVVFSNQTGVFSGSSNEKFLNLVAQELNIIPRDSSYVNPYKEANIKAALKKKKEMEEKVLKEKEAKKKEKKIKKQRKGPRLGGSSEL